MRHLYLDWADVFMTGMSAVVDGAPSWVAEQGVGGQDLAQPFAGIGIGFLGGHVGVLVT